MSVPSHVEPRAQMLEVLAGSARDVEQRLRVRAAARGRSRSSDRDLALVVLERVLEVVELGSRRVRHRTRECDDFVPVPNGHLRSRRLVRTVERMRLSLVEIGCSSPPSPSPRRRCRAARAAARRGGRARELDAHSRRPQPGGHAGDHRARRSAVTAGRARSGRPSRTRTRSRRRACGSTGSAALRRRSRRTT